MPLFLYKFKWSEKRNTWSWISKCYNCGALATCQSCLKYAFRVIYLIFIIQWNRCHHLPRSREVVTHFTQVSDEAGPGSQAVCHQGSPALQHNSATWEGQGTVTLPLNLWTAEHALSLLLEVACSNTLLCTCPQGVWETFKLFYLCQSNFW